VNPIGAGGLDAVDLLSEPRKICGQNGWGDDYFSH
jgi:hypothetical protein